MIGMLQRGQLFRVMIHSLVKNVLDASRVIGVSAIKSLGIFFDWHHANGAIHFCVFFSLEIGERVDGEEYRERVVELE